MNEYEIIEQIKQTRISTLFRAVKKSQNEEQTSLTFLIKKYHADVSDDLIKNERIISQTLENNCKASLVIPIFESFQEDGERCVVMQFRQNGLFLNTMVHDLEQQYGEGKIPLKIILEITSKILKTLSLFHTYPHDGETSGYLHLDLNPGNIFFESANPEKGDWGEVKFIDFGSSVMRRKKNETLKDRNWVCISSGYAAPEMEENIISHIIPATDLYSVCACMVRMMTGSSFQRIEQADMEEYMENKDPVISFFVKNIIENASCSPSYYRYEDADQMKNDIDSLLKYISYIEEGNYYQLLCSCYERSFPDGPLLQADRAISVSGFAQAVTCLREDLKIDRVKPRKCLYIFKNLYKMSKQFAITDRKINSSLLESGMSSYNNMGQTINALELYEELFPYMSTMPMESYITTQLRYAVTAADCYEFEKAFNIVYELIQGMEAFKSFSRDAGNIRITELGRAYSAAGTYLAFQKKKDPIEMYQKALHEFQGDEANSAITYSKILHYAIDIKNQELFEEYVPFYMKVENLTATETSKKLLDQESNSPYMIFLYLKSIYTFYYDQIDEEFFTILDQFLKREQAFRKEHPEQMFFKYAGLLFYKHGNYQKAKRYFDKSIEWLQEDHPIKSKNLNISMLMSYQTQWIENETVGKKEENQKLLCNLKRQSKASSWETLYEKIEKEQTLQFILNHEYC